MKRKLEAELKDLANKILNHDLDNISSLKEKAREIYEKITILAFTEANLEAFSSEASSEKSAEAISAELNKKPEAAEIPPDVIQLEAPKPKEKYKFIPHIIEKAPKAEEAPKAPEKDEYLPDGTEYNDAEAITEPNTEKIKDIVAHMPPETQKLDFLINRIISKNGVDKIIDKPGDSKTDFRNIGVDYDNLPSFEPVKKSEENKPRSLNDRLKKGINIGLNERLAFIRHLFDGKTADYNRVISQLNSFDSVSEAKKFIQLVVKPDYKNWAGKEEYEQKFLDHVENKFKH